METQLASSAQPIPPPGPMPPPVRAPVRIKPLNIEIQTSLINAHPSRALGFGEETIHINPGRLVLPMRSTSGLIDIEDGAFGDVAVGDSSHRDLGVILETPAIGLIGLKSSGARLIITENPQTFRVICGNIGGVTTINATTSWSSASIEIVVIAALPISLATLQAIMPHAPARFLDPLNAAMARYNIDTVKRIAGFLSQLAEESNQLRHLHEAFTLRKNFQLPGVLRPPHTATSEQNYFEYWYGKRNDLGNHTALDGYTFRGRGAIQLTGRSMYRAVGVGIGRPLEANPDFVETDDEVDMQASAFFFARLKKLNPVADRVDSSNNASISQVNGQLTRAVNGGVNGLAERLNFYKKALRVLLAIPPLAPRVE
jgi:putative chitinase